MKYCLGTVQFGMDYGIQGAHKPSQESVNRMFDLAIENGIDSFDTAAAYGQAESTLGNYFFQKNFMGNFKVISKLAPNVFYGEKKEKWKNIVIDNIKSSLKRMNVFRLEGYLFHNASYIFDKDAVQALYSVVEEGLSGKVGVSIYTPEEAMKALEYDEIQVIQIPYNLFDHRLDKCGFFEKAKKKGIEIYARSSLLQGLVVMNPQNLSGKMRFAQDYIKKFRLMCAEFGITPLEVAVSYVGGHDGIDYVVFGVDSLEQLKAYILVKSKSIPQELQKRIRIEFDNVEDRLINPVLWNQN